MTPVQAVTQQPGEPGDIWEESERHGVCQLVRQLGQRQRTDRGGPSAEHVSPQVPSLRMMGAVSSVPDQETAQAGYVAACDLH